MNRLRNPTPYLLVLACLMVLICLCSARIMSAQTQESESFYKSSSPFKTIAILPATMGILRQGDTEAIVAPLGIPCESGDLIFGLFACPPVEQQGVLVHVRSDDWRTGSHEEYAVTIIYRTAAGERRTATATAKRERSFGKEWDDGWRAVGFNVGRIATGPLSGITVESVAVSKVAKPVVITLGKTEIGPPK